MTNKLLRAVLTLSLLSAPALIWAQPAAPAAPAAPAPTTRPNTPEEQAAIDAYNKADPAMPMQKMSMSVFNRDKTKNENFGKPDGGFMKRHAMFMERSHQPAQVVFIGDSITQGWEGGGKQVWADNYDKYQAANFGIGGDRTEHVLWRIQEGELDGFKAMQPKVVVIMIGTNNSGKPADQIAAGTTAVVKAVHEKLPESKILLLSIFPRSPKPEDGARKKIADANETLKKLDGSMDGKVKYFELWNQFLTADGMLTKEIMPDALHPNAKGYQIWADAMNPVLEEMMK